MSSVTAAWKVSVCRQVRRPTGAGGAGPVSLGGRPGRVPASPSVDALGVERGAGLPGRELRAGTLAARAQREHGPALVGGAADEIPGQGCCRPGGSGASWNRTSDLTLIRGAL